MEATTKVGVVTGTVTALIGGIAAFIAYKEGHSDGHVHGLSEGFGLAERKFKGLEEKCNEMQEQIQNLKEFRERLEREGCERDRARAILEELYLFLKEKQIVSEDVCNELKSLVSHGQFDGFMQAMDNAIDVETEKCKAIRCEQTTGKIVFPVESGWFKDDCHISFGNGVTGVYVSPVFSGSILPDTYVLLSCPKLLEKIMELIPGWRIDKRENALKMRQIEFWSPVASWRRNIESELQDMELRGRGTEDLLYEYYKQKEEQYESYKLRVERDEKRLTTDAYDYDCICAAALAEMSGKTVKCDKVTFAKGLPWYCSNESEIDYEHGIVESKILDDYLTRKCLEVRDKIAAFLALLSDDDKKAMADRRAILSCIASGAPLYGTVVVKDGVPYVRFCDGICIRLLTPIDQFALYFEGDDFTVRTNDDLRKNLLAQLPNWDDTPISDARIDGMLRSFCGLMTEEKRGYSSLGSGLYVKSSLPAEGAVREFLRFKDAAKILCDNVLHDMSGRRILCQSIAPNHSGDSRFMVGVKICGEPLKDMSDTKVKMLCDAVAGGESLVTQSDELIKTLHDAVEDAQKRLEEFAKTRNAVLYCHGDLFPEVKTSRYYEKWKAFDRLATMPQLRVGDVVTGVVRNVKEYGAFIDFSGTSGLLHISEIRNGFVRDINEFLKVGQRVEVKIVDIDTVRGRISLSRKQLNA